MPVILNACHYKTLMLTVQILLHSCQDSLAMGIWYYMFYLFKEQQKIKTASVWWYMYLKTKMTTSYVGIKCTGLFGGLLKAISNTNFIKIFKILWLPLYLVSIFNMGLKSLPRPSLSDLEFYGDSVYKFRKFVGPNDFSDQFWKIIICYKMTGNKMNVIWHWDCMLGHD